MPELSREEVESIALLARLKLEPEELESLRGELSAILAYMETLQAVDTEGVDPMTHAVPLDLRLREDAIEPSLSVHQALAHAPDRADDCFRVPDIIKTATARGSNE